MDKFLSTIRWLHDMEKKETIHTTEKLDNDGWLPIFI
jgi:hypothetical protein